MQGLNFSEIAGAYIQGTKFIYASQEANSYIKSLLNSIELSNYAIRPEKYDKTLEEMRIFLCDTINQTLYAFKQHMAYNHTWKRKLPISNKRLRKQYPCLLVKERYFKGKSLFNARRGLDILLNEGIIKSHGYKRGVYCSSFSINPDIMDKITKSTIRSYTVADILDEEHVDLSTGEVYSIRSLLQYGSSSRIKAKGLQLPRDHTANERQYKRNIDQILLNRKAVRLNVKSTIKNMLHYVNDRNLPKTRRLAYLVQCKAIILSILQNGFRSIPNARSSSGGIHYKIEYFPQYKLAEIGGRIFEIGGGIQFLKSDVRSKSRDGVDYDFASSQLNILKSLCKLYKIPCEDVDLTKLAVAATNIFKRTKAKTPIIITKQMLKPILYGLLFGAGTFSSTAFTTLAADLSFYYGLSETNFAKLKAFLRDKLSALSFTIKSLVEKLFKDNKYWVKQGTSVFYCKNVLGLTFKTTKGRYTNTPSGVALRKRDQRRVLAHIIQGIEMNNLINVCLETGIQPSSLEHDGMLVDGYVNKKQQAVLKQYTMVTK